MTPVSHPALVPPASNSALAPHVSILTLESPVACLHAGLVRHVPGMVEQGG